MNLLGSLWSLMRLKKTKCCDVKFNVAWRGFQKTKNKHRYSAPKDTRWKYETPMNNLAAAWSALFVELELEAAVITFLNVTNALLSRDFVAKDAMEQSASFSNTPIYKRTWNATTIVI